MSKGEKSKSFLVVFGITTPLGGTRTWGQEVVTRLATQGTEGQDKGTESGNGQLNEDACFCAAREWLLHQFILRAEGWGLLMDGGTQQGSEVSRAN